MTISDFLCLPIRIRHGIPIGNICYNWLIVPVLFRKIDIARILISEKKMVVIYVF